MKKRVLFVLPQLDVGGSERVVFDLAANMDFDKFEVFVAAFRGGELAKPLKAICRDLFIIEKKKGFDIITMMKLANIIKNNSIDVINAHHYMPCFYSFLGSKVFNCKKLIYTEHSIPEVENIANCFHRNIFNCMLYGIDGVIGVSQAIIEKFIEKFPHHAHRFHNVLNGIDIDKYTVTNVRGIIRKYWGLASHHFVVGTVANFRKVKNHVCLVRAAHRLKYSHPQLRLIFVGTGFPDDAQNSEIEVRELIIKLEMQDRVVFAGYQKNIPEILSALDAFCLPSYSEGMPVSMLEAMAARVPVIGSDVQGIVEVVKDGQTGILFPSNSDIELSYALKKILDSSANVKPTLVDNAYKFIEKHHSLKKWQEKYYEILI